MAQRVSNWIWAALAGVALFGCGHAAEQGDETAPFNAIANDESTARAYGLRSRSSSVTTLCSSCSVRAWSPDRRRVLIDHDGELQVLSAGSAPASLALDLSQAPGGGIPSSWQLQSAWSDDGSWLAYVWNGAQAFIADGDGRNPIELVTSEAPRAMPSLAPWDSSVAIGWASTAAHVALRFASGSVYIAAPGSNAAVALEGAWDTATWSPDGAVLALTGAEGAELVAAADGNVRTLETGASTRAIGWSSDSTRFAYLLAGGLNMPERVQLAAANGSDTLSAGPAQQGAWAPFTSLLALGRELDKDAAQPGRLSVWSLDAEGDIATESLGPAYRVQAMAWSSSGERLLYEVASGGPEPYWAVMDPTDGSELQRFSGYLFPVWNRAGSELATLTSVKGTWKLELQSEAASARLLGEGITGADGWAWLSDPVAVAFANADGIFISDLRGSRTRVARTEGSHVRFFRATPGVSACPRAGGDCSGL
jgi:Tol biopolymer transport system component